MQRVCVYVYVEVAARLRAYKKALRCAYKVCGMAMVEIVVAATNTIKKSNFYIKMSNIFYKNAKKLNFFVKFCYNLFK